MHRYDQQQSTYLPDREQRFTVMLDVLDTLLPEHFVALDQDSLLEKPFQYTTSGMVSCQPLCELCAKSFSCQPL